jgi:GntR family transcriptional regulator
MADALQILVSESDGTPVYLQIAHQIMYLIYSQRLSDGEQLPTVRALAAQIQVNPNTVTQAYLELQRSGLAAARRGRGTFVTADAGTLDRHWALRHELLLADLRRSRRRAHALGFNDPALRSHLFGLMQAETEKCETAFVAPGKSAEKYARALTSALADADVTVTPVDLEHVQLGERAARDVLERVFYVLTPVSMRSQLEELLAFDTSPHAVLGISLDLTRAAVDRVASLPPDCHVCVYTSQRYIAIALNILHTYGSAPLASVKRVLDTSHPDVIRAALEAADVVVFTFGVIDSVNEFDVPVSKRLELEFHTSTESVNQLREFFSSRRSAAIAAQEH